MLGSVVFVGLVLGMGSIICVCVCTYACTFLNVHVPQPVVSIVCTQNVNIDNRVTVNI